jgi:hypothetical protein
VPELDDVDDPELRRGAGVVAELEDPEVAAAVATGTAALCA